MSSNGFVLLRPRSADEALEYKRSYGSAALALAGGTVLVPELRRRRGEPLAVVDLSGAGLDAIAVEDGETAVGAMATYRRLIEASERSPALRALGSAAATITGGPQTRNRGTIGGSAMYANPSSDLPVVLTALQARLTLASTRGRRAVDADSFFLDAFRVDACEDELLVSISVPEPRADASFAYEKLKFGSSSWPIASAACLARADGTGRIVVGGCTPVPLVLELPAPGLDEAVVAGVTEPWTDVLASAAYRRHVAPVVARRALQAATRGGGRTA